MKRKLSALFISLLFGCAAAPVESVDIQPVAGDPIDPTSPEAAPAMSLLQQQGVTADQRSECSRERDGGVLCCASDDDGGNPVCCWVSPHGSRCG